MKRSLIGMSAVACLVFVADARQPQPPQPMPCLSSTHRTCAGAHVDPNRVCRDGANAQWCGDSIAIDAMVQDVVPSLEGYSTVLTTGCGPNTGVRVNLFRCRPPEQPRSNPLCQSLGQQTRYCIPRCPTGPACGGGGIN